MAAYYEGRLPIEGHHASIEDRFFSELKQVSLSDEQYEEIGQQQLQYRKNIRDWLSNTDKVARRFLMPAFEIYNQKPDAILCRRNSYLEKIRVLSYIEGRRQNEGRRREKTELIHHIGRSKHLLATVDDICSMSGDYTIGKFVAGLNNNAKRLMLTKTNAMKSLAIYYSGRSVGLEKSILVQDASVAVYRAGQLWNPENSRFTSYSQYAIQNAMKNTLNRHLKGNKMTQATAGKLGDISRYETWYFTMYNTLPDVSSIAYVCNMTEAQVMIAKGFKNAEVPYRDDMDLGRPITTDQAMDYQGIVDFLKTKLTKREVGIILRRAEGESLQSIGDDYGISRERVRQIENNIKTKMRTQENKAVLLPEPDYYL